MAGTVHRSSNARARRHALDMSLTVAVFHPLMLRFHAAAVLNMLAMVVALATFQAEMLTLKADAS